jgi:hypothetical protein
MITNAIRKQRAENVLFIPLEEVEHVNIQCITEDETDFDYGKALATAERVLADIARERPKNAFVFRVHLGFHPYAALNRDTLSELAREVRLSKAECRHVRYAADRLNAAEYLGRKALSQDVTGSLVSIHSRQVRAIIARIKDLIRRSSEPSEINVSRPAREAPALMTKDECRGLAHSTTAANGGTRSLNTALRR